MARIWFVESEITIELTTGELSILGELGGTEDSMFDIVSYVWNRDSLTGVAPAGFAATAEGSEALWASLEGRPVRDRLAAIIQHQLTYLERVTVCYEWVI